MGSEFVGRIHAALCLIHTENDVLPCSQGMPMQAVPKYGSQDPRMQGPDGGRGEMTGRRI